MKTEQLILKRALELFNQRGIEYVGLRELAGDLKIRVSNINYYFPTKDDLVDRLSQELAILNSKTIFPMKELDIPGFFGMMQQVFLNQIEYRCLLISFVHLLKQNSKIADRYQQTAQTRNSTLHENFLALEKSGNLHLPQSDDLQTLVNGVSLIVRFWISEATISTKSVPLEQHGQTYLKVIARLLKPFVTEKGSLALQPFL